MTNQEEAAIPAQTGLGPHGERPAGSEFAQLTPEVCAQAQTRGFEVAVLLHTQASDWSQRQIAGIRTRLADAGAHLSEIVDCDYRPDLQIAAVERLVAARPDAVIAIPVGGTAVADAFRRLSAAGIRLVLLDNVPSGLLPERDYVSAVSADNFRLGQIAAQLLAPHVPHDGRVCVAAYNVDYFATAQREIAFGKWMRRERPDIHLDPIKFEAPARAGEAVSAYLERGIVPDGFFIVWDEPAVAALPVLATCRPTPSMTTVDLGSAAARALGEGRILRGVAAQRPFEQGLTAASAAILSLTDRSVPPWIVIPGIAVTKDNVAAVYRDVGGTPSVPPRLRER